MTSLSYRLTEEKAELLRSEFSWFGYTIQWVLQLVMSLVFLFGFVTIPLKILRNLSSVLFRRRANAVIQTMTVEPALGASWFWWTRVTFLVNGKPRKLKLSSSQAVRFIVNERHREGETGRLSWFLGHLCSWTADKPAEGHERKVFLSYAHEEQPLAQYIANLFRSQGLEVWLDDSAIEAGKSLPAQVQNGIEGADRFVPLISQAYVASEWCVRELEVAKDTSTQVVPIQVTEGEVFIPEHLRRLLDEVGDPVFVDLQAREGADQVRRLARSIREDAPLRSDEVANSRADAMETSRSR